jgi:hypothetical protein
MTPFIQSVVAFGREFGNAVNLVGACVLLSRIALLLLPRAAPGDTTSWYALFRTHLYSASLSVGHLNSQL